MPDIVKIKFKAREGWESYSGKLGTFKVDGEVRELPEASAIALAKARPDIFELVKEQPPVSLPPIAPSETKIVIPDEAKTEPPPEIETEHPPNPDAGSFNQGHADLVPQQMPGELKKDYAKRLAAWERER